MLHDQFSEQLFNLFMLGNQKRVLHEKIYIQIPPINLLNTEKNKADSHQLG